MSRVDAARIAVQKAADSAAHNDWNVPRTRGAVAASDAFFPFIDGIEKLVQSGVTAVIQPAGSIRDGEIIKFANSTETVLVFSNTRHFRH